MNEIVFKQTLSPEIKLYKVRSPLIAQKRKAGQFVVVRLDEKGERIPLTIADSDPQEGTITLVVQEVGATTKRMGLLGEGDRLWDVVGPLGEPTEIKDFGTVRVGVIGVVTPETPSIVMPGKTGEILFGEPLRTIQGIMNSLREEGVAFTVVLSHLFEYHNRCNEQQENDGDCACSTVIEEIKHFLIHPVGNHLGIIGAIGHDEYNIEDLKYLNGHGSGNHGNRRCHQR